MSEQSLRHHVITDPEHDDPFHEYSTEVEVLRDRNAVVAVVRLQDAVGHPILTATGSAKRMPGDPVNNAGDALAIGRAFIALGQELEAAGNDAALDT